MELGLDKRKLQEYRAAALKHLGEPSKLRLLVAGGVVLLSLVCVYAPLTQQIDRRRAQVAEQKRQLEAIRDVEALRAEVASFRQRIPRNADTNEWVQYILDGLRTVRVKLRDMSSKPPEKVGPYRTVSLSLEVEGTYEEVKRFVEWLDTSDRLLRVDSIRLDRQPHSLVMKLVLLGMVDKHAKAT